MNGCSQEVAHGMEYLIQLKNVYSKNRLSVTTKPSNDTFLSEEIFSSRPPFSSGWFWTISPHDNNQLLHRHPIKCGSNVTLSSSINNKFLGIHKTVRGFESIPFSHGNSLRSKWSIVCRSGEFFETETQFELKNVAEDCFLSTSIDKEVPGSINKYYVDCENESMSSVWYVSEGIFLPEDEKREKAATDRIPDDL